MSRSQPTPPAAPIPYAPTVETPHPDEAQIEAQILDSMRRIREQTLADYGRAVRSVHAKSHGVLKGELRVLPDLPRSLAQGLFEKPGTYPVALRLSTTPGDILDDSISTPRGLSIKVTGIDGERLPGSDGARTQDFVLVNGPAFQSNARMFAQNLKLLEKTTDRLDRTKKVVAALNRGLETLVEAFGGQSAKLQALGGHPMTHILGETFYSQAALRYGDYIAKISVAPVSPELQALKGAPLDLAGRPDGLREAVVDFFRTHGGEWELRVQLCTDLERMPVEDAAVLWPEDESPYIPVARIAAPPQEAWSDGKAAAIDEGLSFSPWHGIAAHRPLGIVMRLRRKAYEASAAFRAEHNGHPVKEPQTLDDVPA